MSVERNGERIVKTGDVDLMCGDCLELMSSISDGSVDMCLCDLPYGVLNRGNESAAWDRELPLDELWAHWRRIVKPDGAIVLFGQGMFSAKLMMSQPRMYRYSLVWDKVRPTGFLNANRMPLRRHEDILMFYRRPPVYHPQMRAVPDSERNHVLTRSATNSCYGSYNQDYPCAATNEKFPTSILRFGKKHRDWHHPTEKDVPLLEYLIRSYTDRGDRVLDCVMGSGSTMVACVETGRKGIGIELQPEYFDIAVGRVREAVRNTRRSLFDQY
jgi:hypothetical protein BACCOPRO_01768